MSHIVTHEELFILDELLEHLLLRGAFTLDAIHANFVLHERYRNENGGTDLQGVYNAVADNTERNIYSHITGFLIKNGFVEETADRLLVLTRKGEYLSAHQKLEIYNWHLSFIYSEEQIKSRVPLLISKISPYGVFALAPPPAAKPTDVFLNISPTSVDADTLREINEDIRRRRFEYMRDLVSEHTNLLYDERVAGYLVNEGFATERFDVPSETTIYRQLTDRGRKLKEKGSIEAFDSWIREENEKEDNRKALEIANIHFQERQVTFNLWIAIGTIISASYNIVQIVQSSPTDIEKKGAIIIFSFGIVLGGLIAIALQGWVKKSKN